MVEFTYPTELQLKIERITDEANKIGYVGVYQVMIKAMDASIDFNKCENYDDVCVALFKKRVKGKKFKMRAYVPKEIMLGKTCSNFANSFFGNPIIVDAEK